MKNVRGNILVLLAFSLTLFVAGFIFFLVAKPVPPSGSGPGSAPVAISAPSVALTWPPQLHRTYPNLKLLDQTGNLVELNSFRGKVLLIEPIGMTCPACQAFCGAKKFGAFCGIPPQKDLPSIEEAMILYGNGAVLSEVVYIQLLLYNLTMDAPTGEDARQWAEHFQMDRSKNQIVLAGSPDLISPASYKMIPGFQLVDKNFVLRVDSTGHQPRHNLYQELLPAIPTLLAETIAIKNDISVEAAYGKVPKGRYPRTPFDPGISVIPQAEKTYLEQLFRLTDKALVQRVQTLNWFQSGGSAGENFDYYYQHINEILQQLGQLVPPKKLKPSHDLLIQAIQEQCSFFEQWDTALQQKKSFPYRVYQGDPIHPLVTQSSTKLQRAYHLLLGLYPSEAERNKQAFFAHLCYLDFI